MGVDRVPSTLQRLPRLDHHRLHSQRRHRARLGKLGRLRVKPEDMGDFDHRCSRAHNIPSRHHQKGRRVRVNRCLGVTGYSGEAEHAPHYSHSRPSERGDNRRDHTDRNTAHQAKKIGKKPNARKFRWT